MAFPTGWGRQCALTINHTKIPSTQTNFPVLIGYNVTPDNATNLPTEMLVTGGSNAAQSTGADIRFSSDSAGSNGLHAEIVVWTQDATTDANRKAEIWVNCSPSSSTDTTIYVWYKNPSATAPAANDATFGSQGVWSNNYIGVWHFPNGSTLNTNDSTANANNGTNTGATATGGQIDGGAFFTGINTHIDMGNNSTLQPSQMTISAWVNATSYAVTQFNNIAIMDQASSPFGWGLRINTMPSDQLEYYASNASSLAVVDTTAPSLGTTHFVAGAFDNTNVYLYLDSVLQASSPLSGAMSLSAGDFEVGDGFAFSGRNWNGMIDEVRYSSIARSQNWLTAEFNNQKSPSTFWTVGIPTNTGGGVLSPIIEGLVMIEEGLSILEGITTNLIKGLYKDQQGRLPMRG